MKIKTRPDDFQVEEITSVLPGDSGDYSFYRLSKRSIGTPEAIQKICRELRVDAKRVRYGGLKDRHAETVQYLTIEQGPKRSFRSDEVQLKYLGSVNEPYGPTSFTANRFIITIRDLKQAAFEQALAMLEESRTELIANYFDDQRFGSVSSDNSFVARALIEGDDELALRLALCTHYEHDRSSEKKTKKLLRTAWGKWSIILPELPRGYVQQVIAFLTDQPENYREAFNRIPFFLRNMYLSAYQSYLWNRVLAHWLLKTLPVSQILTIQLKRFRLPMPYRLAEDQRCLLADVEIPLPSSRTEITSEHPAAASLVQILREEQLELSDIKLKHYREPFFSKGNRRAFYTLHGLQYEVGWDKLHKGNRKLQLQFTLPRGSYATILIKRITAELSIDHHQ